jgi:hypothetical protein
MACAKADIGASKTTSTAGFIRRSSYAKGHGPSLATTISHESENHLKEVCAVGLLDSPLAERPDVHTAVASCSAHQYLVS